MSEREQDEMQASVPYFVHEGVITRMYRIIRMLALLLVAALVIFVINNVIWMRYVERQRAEMSAEEQAEIPAGEQV